MSFTKNNLSVLCFSILMFLAMPAKAQILADQQIKAVITEGLDYCYNFEFEKAKASYAKVQQKYPNSPAYATLMHMLLFTQYAPVKDYPKAKALYLQYLHKSVELSEKLIAKNENDPEAIFFMLSSLGSLAAWQGDNDEMMKAVNTARKAYPYMKKGLKLTDKQADFMFTSGLYNYYVEQYPEDHPIIKPFMIFFSDGNKKLGIQQLEACNQKAIFTFNEAGYYYAYINIKHENRPDKALAMLEKLHQKYPNNLLYLSRIAECLVATGRYTEAKKLTERLAKENGNVYPMAALVCEGIIHEKHDKNDIQAQAHYQKALKYPIDVRYTQDYHAMAYLGLGRIAIRAKKNKEAQTYLNKAISMSEYQSTTAEAKRLLKSM